MELVSNLFPQEFVEEFEARAKFTGATDDEEEEGSEGQADEGELPTDDQSPDEGEGDEGDDGEEVGQYLADQVLAIHPVFDEPTDHVGGRVFRPVKPLLVL